MPRLFDGVALVSFGGATPAPPPIRATPPPPPIVERVPTPTPPAPLSVRSAAASDATDDNAVDPLSRSPDSVDPRRPPKLPDLSAVHSPVIRCQKIVDWIGEATGAVDVFLADASGLPIAGAIEEAEARLAGAGLVAASVTQLAASLPGNGAPLFELHLGDGPFFQLVGFEAQGAFYLVGLNRVTPLTPRQAHAIRLACRHALGDVLGSDA